jgi:1,4-dihydroxy-2-naphthoate octaprenyltransferase
MRAATVPTRQAGEVTNRWILGARPRTLPAAVVPVAVGTACAVGEPSPDWWRAVPALVVSLALQVGVNYANDYSDGVRGTDAERVGPVRLVGSGLASPGSVKRAAFAAFGVAAAAGLLLAALTSWWLLAVGVAAIAAAWFYTGGPRPYGYAGFGELFVFVFFGLVATVGTFYVVAERLTALAWVASIPVGLLACALLIVNNLRDIPTDRESGKRTLAVRLGDARTRWLYVAAMVLAGVLVISVAGSWRWPALLGLGATATAVPAIRLVRGGASGRELIAVLGATGRTQLVFGALFALGIALGG